MMPSCPTHAHTHTHSDLLAGCSFEISCPFWFAGTGLMRPFGASLDCNTHTHTQGPLTDTVYCETGSSATSCSLQFAVGITSNTNYVVYIMARDAYGNFQQVAP